MKSKTYNAANTNNATVVSAKPAALGSLTVFNAGGAAAYLKLYNSAALPVPGTDTPVMVVAVPTISASFR